MGDWANQNQDNLGALAEATNEFNELARNYAYQLQAESNEALEPLAEFIGTLGELGATDPETCDSHKFAECIANDPQFGRAVWIWPMALESECATSTGCQAKAF